MFSINVLAALSILSASCLAADVTATFASHNTIKDCWVQRGSNAYDITAWAQQHPGGPDVYSPFCGKSGPGFDKALKDTHQTSQDAAFLGKCPLKGSLGGAGGAATGYAAPSPPANQQAAPATQQVAPVAGAGYTTSAPTADDCEEDVAPQPADDCEEDKPVPTTTSAPVQVTSYAAPATPYTQAAPVVEPPCTETPAPSATTAPVPAPSDTAAPVADPTPATYPASTPAPVDSSSPVLSASTSLYGANILASTVLVMVAAAFANL